MKIQITTAFLLVATITLAQSSARRKWEVTALLTKTISKVTDITNDEKCPEVTQKGLDRTTTQFSLHINNAMEVHNGGGLEVAWDASHRASAIVNGAYTNEVKLVSATRYNCPQKCKQTSNTTISSAHGKLVRDESSFDFFYDPVKKQGVCKVIGHFEFTGKSSMNAKGCDNSFVVSSPELDALYVSALGLQGCAVEAYSYDHYLDEGYDAAARQKFDKVDRMFGRGGIAQIRAVGDGYDLSYTYTVTDTKAAAEGQNGGWYTTFTTTLQVSIRPQSKYQAIIEPVEGWTMYKQWLPKGNIEDGKRKPGNHTSFRIKIINTEEPGAAVNLPIKEVSYKLNAVSHLPGVCMNYPVKNPDAKMDYSLVDVQKQKTGPDADELTEITLPSALELMVNSYDFGGIARLTAKVKLVSGEELIASNEDDGLDHINIPYRREGDYVSQTWKEQMNVDGLADDNDDESAGNGIGETYSGDGYTLFEEYRGFREDGKHIRTLPKEMDLMLLNLVLPKNRAQDGINLFSGVTGIVTHSKFREEEFGRDQEQPELKAKALAYKAKGIDHDKILNFNFLPEAHAIDQHGILLVSSDSVLGAAVAVNKAADYKSPQDNYFVVVSSADFDPGPEGYSTTRGRIDPSGKIIIDPMGPAKIITDLYASTIAHEMLHACGVKHHGDNDIEGVTLRYNGTTYEAWINGSYVPITIRKNDQAGTILTNSKQDSEYLRTHFRMELMGMDVAVQGGQHSGMEDCIMRYDVAASFFTRDMKTLYLLESPNASDLPKKQFLRPELTGINLCGSPEGTGVNAKNAKPRPRYGDATNGNCRSQVRLNDK